MYVSIPENGYKVFSEGLAVKFIKKDNSEWIGNFERGNSSLKFASKLKNSENILIIAFGICYIMNAENTKPIIEFGYDYKKVFEYKNILILIGEYSISVVESIDKIKHFDDLCYDGITNVELENEKIIGILNNFNPSGNGYIKNNFSLNLETLEFNETKITEKEEENIKVKKKRWWEIFK